MIITLPFHIAPKMLLHNPGHVSFTLLAYDSSTTFLRLLNGVGLGGLRICHLCVLLLGGGSVALLGLRLALLALDLGLLGGGLLLPLLALFRLLLLELVVVALDDGAGNGADVLLLGDVEGLGGVLAVLVQPVLYNC
jgi:hypothetical protein